MKTLWTVHANSFTICKTDLLWKPNTYHLYIIYNFHCSMFFLSGINDGPAVPNDNGIAKVDQHFRSRNTKGKYTCVIVS